MATWIDLKDATTKGRLKILVLDEETATPRKFLVVVGMPATSDRWAKAVTQLNFVESPSRKYLLRQINPGEKITPAMFRSVWPNAAMAEMSISDIRMELKGAAARRAAEDREKAPVDEPKADIELGEVVRLGRNADGEVVFKSPLGRYIERKGGNVFEGGALLSPALFLRASDEEQERLCADGFVQGMVAGEVQHSNDFSAFLAAITDSTDAHPVSRIDSASAAIESAVMRFLTQKYQTTQDAFGDAARLYEYLPPYQGTPRGLAAMPIPLSVMAQRLLGDTAGKEVVYPDAYDGASFSFLNVDTGIRAYRGAKNISQYARNANAIEAVWADNYEPLAEPQADAMFINKDPVFGVSGRREDFGQTLSVLRGLKNDGRAVIVLAAGENERSGELRSESADFYEYLAKNFEIEASFEIPAQMTNRVGSNRALRTVAIKNRRPRHLQEFAFRVVNSWDECKTYIDEAVVNVGLKEVESDGIDVDRLILENEFQRPYISFSKTAEATTMVPKNLQAPMQAALSSIEFLEGDIDTFVESELQFGENTLGERLSPEQIDAIALGISSIKHGRAPILADETGIGKGRTLASFAVWAQKQGRPIIFITDKANLYSDFVRDLRHIEEWGRFRPMLMNAGAVIVDGETKEVIHEGTPATEVKGIVDGMVPLDVTNYNLVFTSYSQIATEDSAKAEWLLAQAPNALVIIDEAHVAAGSDSNMSRVVVDLETRAWGVVYSSATWAKSSENLHIFSRAFPPAINIATLTTTMRSGGEAFAEVFSSMLAKDGVFIRREHDLSKLEMVVETDTANLNRNSAITDKVAEILGAMTFVGGEINRLLMRANGDTIASLKAAREAHAEVVGAVQIERTRSRRARAAENQEAIENGEALPPAPPKPVTLFKSSFGAGTVLYQVMRRVLAILNADNTARLALEAISQQRKPVIVFEDTGETFIRQIMEELTIPAIEGDASIVPSHIPAPTIRDMLMKIISRMGVIQKRQVLDTDILNERVENDGEVDVDALLGSGSWSQELTLENLPGLSDQRREDYLEGIKKIVALIEKMPPLPLNAIDVVRGRLEAAGVRVGEISGRRMFLDMPDSMKTSAIDGGWIDDATSRSWKVGYRNKSKKAVSMTTFDFNNGDIDALVINRSAATGISLHASPRFADRRRRELIEMQIPENPTDRIQLYGRVNRYDQVVGPKISIATTGVYGEVRQLMMQNKKLAKLSANVRSSRDNAAEIKHIVDIINPVGEQVCRRFLEDNSPIRQRLGITDHEMENRYTSLASKLTSRLVLLRVAEQKMVYEELYSSYDEEIIRLDLAGKNPLKSREMDIRAKVTKSRIAIGVEMDGLGSAFDGPVYLRELEWKQTLRPLDWIDLKTMIRASRDNLVKLNYAKINEQLYAPVPKGPETTVVIDDGDEDGQYGLFSEGMTIAVDDLAATIADPISAPVAAQVLDVETEVEQLRIRKNLLSAALLSAYGPYAPSLQGAVVVDAEVGPKANDMKTIVDSWCQSLEIYSTLGFDRVKKTLCQVLGDRARLSLSGTEFVDLESALRSTKKNPAKEMWGKRLWVDRHFEHIQPGCLIAIDPYADETRKKGATVAERLRNMNLFRERAMVTALIPPPEGKEANLSKWKIEAVVATDEKPRQFSLSKLLEDVSLMPLMRDEGNFGELVEDQSILRLTGGPTLLGFAFAGQPVQSEYDPIKRIRETFSNLEHGQRVRKGHVLEGNMYLASEWAQATGKGNGVIYTDESGVRHRAIFMPRDSMFRDDRDMFNNLPVRLWVPEMISEFVNKISDAENGDASVPRNFGNNVGYLFKTDFASAMVDTVGGKQNASQFVVVPDKFIAVAMSPKENARAARALRSEAKRLFALKHPDFLSYTHEQKQAAKSDQIKISSTAKRGAPSMVMIEATTRSEMDVAIKMISKAIGMELYLWPTSRAGQLASECVAKYFEARREEARSVRDAAMARRAQVVPAIAIEPVPTQMREAA